MTYPRSSAVNAGDATLANHYNYLRNDALFLGQSAANGVNLGTLLEHYHSRLEIERLSTDTVRVCASATEPVSLMVDGYLVQAVANVDLADEDKPSGAASTYYVFAVRADASTTFTLSVSTSSTETASHRRIGRFYWDGSKIEKDSVRTEFAEYLEDVLYFQNSLQVCGRLTLATGDPANDDTASSGNVYFSPYLGNRVPLYVPGYGFRVYTFSELTLDISGISSGVNFDIFLYDDAGTLKLAFTEWNNDTQRATNLILQDGMYVKTGALKYLYLGTGRTSGAGVCTFDEGERNLWNMYNRLPFGCRKMVSAVHTYTSTTKRFYNNSSSSKFHFVVGLDHLNFVAHLFGYSKSSGYLYIGLNGTTDTSDPIVNQYTGSYIKVAGFEPFTPDAGYNFVGIYEAGSGSAGDFSTTVLAFTHMF